MMIANRLVFFIATLVTFYACNSYPSTIKKKQPLVIKRVAYMSLLIGIDYVLSGLIFSWLRNNGGHYGNQVVTDLVSVAIISLLVTCLSFFAPGNKIYLTNELKKNMVFISLLLSLATFSLFSTEAFIKELLVFSGMYVVFTICFAGIKDRMQIAPIPNFIKGLPLDLLTLFLILLSFSFLNGVFFDQLF
ncbi:MAG TPA: hypothetical protein H9829_07580 [Candidatus Tetragenococcus pullicola]|nr:hypothetical protein [Candidatus Tetragenococcus pullicola]